MLSSRPATSASRNLNLLHQLVRRDFSARFVGSSVGLGWAILQPLCLVTLYWFVFTFMIPQGPGAKDHSYIAFLISGLVPWIGFNEGIMRSTTAIVDNSSLVRRMASQTELLIVVPNVSAILFELIGLALFLIFLAAHHSLSPLLWTLPFAVVLQFAIQVGVGWLLSGLYVFFRDLVQIMGFVLTIVFYLSPILYPVSQRFTKFFYWNPITPLLGLFRSALTGAALPSVPSIVFVVIVAVLSFISGLSCFRRAQYALVDMI